MCFCEKHPDTAGEIEKYLDFIAEIENRGDIAPEIKAGISAISADVLRPLIDERDPEIREKALLSIEKAVKSRKNVSDGRFKKKKKEVPRGGEVGFRIHLFCVFSVLGVN